MGAWQPDVAEVSEQEFIGRRLFGKSGKGCEPDGPLAGVVDSSWFHDTRLNEDLSVDRKGESQRPASVRRHLTRCSDDEAAKMGKSFNGWAVIQVKKLKAFSIRPDGLAGVEGMIDNPYHALIDRSKVADKEDQHLFACALAFQFSQSGIFVEPQRDGA